MSQKVDSNPFPANDRTSTPTGTTADVVNGGPSLTVQERVDLAGGGTDNLCMPSFRLDPERPFGHPLTICLQLRYRGVSAEASTHRLTPDERGFFTNSIIHTLGRLISKKSAPLSRERKQFTHYTDLLLQLKEDRASLLYSQQGARIPITVYCRSMEELDEIWAQYQSGNYRMSYSCTLMSFIFRSDPFQPTSRSTIMKSARGNSIRRVSSALPPISSADDKKTMTSSTELSQLPSAETTDFEATREAPS